MNKRLILIAGGLIVVVIIILIVILFSAGGSKIPENITLEFWGVFDDNTFYEEAFDLYEADHPNVRIVYRKFNFEDYEKELISAFAAGRGPDIWLMHNTWLPKHKDKIFPLPQVKLEGQDTALYTIRRFQEEFFDVAAKDLTDDGQIYSMPLYIDTLALYYNKDIFADEGIPLPPKTWKEFNNTVEKLTRFDDRNNITRSAAAIGTARNINRSTDVLMLMMLQSGVTMVDREGQQAIFSNAVQGQNVGEVALQFYTDFADPVKDVYTWNDQMFFSIDAFFTGQTAMMFNYSHHIPTLRDKSARFNFGVASMPQIEGTTPINYANYWAPTVARISQNPVDAWEFIVFLTTDRSGIGPYLNVSERPVARRELVEFQKDIPDIGVFTDQAISADSWYQIDNVAIETIFADMIDDVNLRRSTVADALENAETKVTLLLNK